MLTRVFVFFPMASMLLTLTFIAAASEPSLEKRRENLQNRMEKILGSDDFADPFDIVNVEPDKLRAAVELLRRSDHLYPKSDPSLRDDHISRCFTLAMLLASKVEKTEADALLSESLKSVRTMSRKGARDFYIEQIRDRQKYGFVDSEKIQTVEDAMKIGKIEWRDGALSSMAQKAAKETPSNFAEALRAAKAISDEDIGNRDLCLGIIAVSQARSGLFDDAEKTLDQIEEANYRKLGFILAFAPIYEQNGAPASAKKKIDAAFELTLLNDESGMAFHPQFFLCCCDCMDRLETREIREYLFEKMVLRQKKYENERPNEQTHESANLVALAIAATKLDDRKSAEKLFQEAEARIVEDEKKWSRAFTDSNRRTLIASLLDAGFQDEGRAMLDEYLKSPELESETLYRFMQTLCGFGLYEEAMAVTVKIPDEKLRFEAYNWFEVSIRFHLDKPWSAVTIYPNRKPFGSAGEIRKVADRLADCPDGASLDRLCAKIRKHADRFEKGEK